MPPIIETANKAIPIFLKKGLPAANAKYRIKSKNNPPKKDKVAARAPLKIKAKEIIKKANA